jgi:hypothetical protein
LIIFHPSIPIGAQDSAPTFTADPPTVVFINELHYDNTGGDADEGVEVAAPISVDVSSLRILFYNQDGATYGSAKELGAPAGQCNDYSLYVIRQSGIQNGDADGLALVDANANTAIQLLSYEGVLTATEGAAATLPSTDIGVAEGGDTPVGHSLQLGGNGGAYDDFDWRGPVAATFGACNAGQDLGAPPTRIELHSFGATVADGTVTLVWETAVEIDSAGFNLYRTVDGADERTQINPSLIAALALPGAGARYAFEDRPDIGAYAYWLEALDTAGTSTYHGPVSVVLPAQKSTEGRLYLPLVRQ